MVRYEMYEDEKQQAYALSLYVPYEDAAGYLHRYGGVGKDDAMNDEYADARKAIAYAAFRDVAEGDLHEDMKRACQADWSDARIGESRLRKLLVELGLLADGGEGMIPS